MSTVEQPRTVGGLLALIDKFSGPSQDIDNFFCSIEEASLLAGWTDVQKPGIVRLKLEGEAREYLNVEPGLRDASYQTLKNKLTERFKNREHNSAAVQRFINCVQKPGETVVQYATKLRKEGLKTKKQTDNEAENKIRQVLLEEQLLAQFLRGLRETKRFVLLRSPETFEEAIKFATEEEMNDILTNGRKSCVNLVNEGNDDYNINTPRSGLTNSKFSKPINQINFSHVSQQCFKCGKVGHLARECRQRAYTQCHNHNYTHRRAANGGRFSNQFEPANNTMTIGQPRNNQMHTRPQNQVECFYCHKVGHLKRDCRQKARNEGRLIQNNPNKQGSPLGGGAPRGGEPFKFKKPI